MPMSVGITSATAIGESNVVKQWGILWLESNLVRTERLPLNVETAYTNSIGAWVPRFVSSL